MKKPRKHTSDTPTEEGTIRKSWSGRTPVALIYPNTYSVGMSNLGFQTVYRLLNSLDHVVCERVFLPAKDARVPVSMESQRRLTEFNILAASISFENDYPNLLALLDRAGIPLRSRERHDTLPLILAGGVACMLNPEPIAPFLDAVLIGDAEVILWDLMKVFREHAESSKRDLLLAMAQQVPGAYIPAFYQHTYQRDGSLKRRSPKEDVPETIDRVSLDDLSGSSTCSSVLTPDTTFDRTFLIEVSRGCPHGCRFCSAGFIHRPPRFRPLVELKEDIAAGSRLTDRIGLVGTAVSDLPDIGALCVDIRRQEARLSFSSFRADALTPELIDLLHQSRVKTATIAPDAGSQRMRDVINKGIDEETVLTAAESLVAGGIPNLKLYFMIGLPTEAIGDVDAIIDLCKRIKHRFLQSSRARKRIGDITVSLSSFVPKPFTPFQWAAMDDTKQLKQKIKRIKQGLKSVPNVRVHADVPRWAYIQALLSRGDRRVGDILELAHHRRGNWPQTLKASPVNPDYFVRRPRERDEPLPWDFIDHGIRKTFLWKEYRRALDARVSPPCPMNDCATCGLCRGDEKTSN